MRGPLTEERRALVEASVEWARAEALAVHRRHRIRGDAEESIAAAYLAVCLAAGSFNPDAAGPCGFAGYAARFVLGEVLDAHRLKVRAVPIDDAGPIADPSTPSSRPAEAVEVLVAAAALIPDRVAGRVLVKHYANPGTVSQRAEAAGVRLRLYRRLVADGLAALRSEAVRPRLERMLG